jgi:hypothetical protein
VLCLVQTHGSECHSENLDLVLKGLTEQFWVVRQSHHVVIGLSQNVNIFGSNR